MKPYASAVLITGLTLLYGTARAQNAVLFNFDSGPLHGGTPLDQTAGGITAHFTASGSSYSIQSADVLGFTPAGFSGYCLYPDSVFASDLMISFNQSLTDVSILYAPEEYATDSSCTMKITAYLGTSAVGTNTTTIATPGTWPTGTLSFSSAEPFDYVVIHYDKPPPTGGDYGPIFMADNLAVTPVPEPGSLVLLALAGILSAGWGNRRILESRAVP